MTMMMMMTTMVTICQNFVCTYVEWLELLPEEGMTMISLSTGRIPPYRACGAGSLIGGKHEAFLGMCDSKLHHQTPKSIHRIMHMYLLKELIRHKFVRLHLRCTPVCEH